MARTDPHGSGKGDPPSGTARHLLLRVGYEILGLPAEAVVEILDPLTVSRMPGAPVAVVGIANHRGSPVTLVDLGLLLGREPVASLPLHRVVVVRWRSQHIALAVDDVVTLGGPSAAVGPAVLDLEALFQPIF